MRVIAGECYVKPIVLKWFQWLGYSNNKIKEFKSWVESNGDNFDDIFKISGTDLRLHHSSTTYWNVHDGSIIIRDITGKYWISSIDKFKEHYLIIDVITGE